MSLTEIKTPLYFLLENFCQYKIYVKSPLECYTTWQSLTNPYTLSQVIN